MSDSINSLSSGLIQPDPTTQAHDKPGKGVASSVSELTPAQQQKESLNVSILESAAVIIGVKDDPLALVLSSAIERINEFLAPELGETSIQKAADSRLDSSPEATAERIVGLSTVFFGEFNERHSSEDKSEVLSHFMENISSGIDQGFAEARDILEGLGVLEGEISKSIDQTFELVKQKLSTFESVIRDRDDLPASTEGGVLDDLS